MHWLPNQHPLFIFAASLAALSATVWIAGSIPNRFRHEGAQNREDFNVIQGVTLTLLGLIIGFTFSMAIGRYDQRKVLEEAEANAIGTAYVRFASSFMSQATTDLLRLMRRPQRFSQNSGQRR